jgi:hypothetical protein
MYILFDATLTDALGAAFTPNGAIIYLRVASFVESIIEILTSINHASPAPIYATSINLNNL